MKKILSVFLVILWICTILISCGSVHTPSESTQDPTEDYDPLNGGTTLKVLGIGNSFSVDTMHFLEDIAKAEGFDTVILGNLYISGCRLDQHAFNATANAPAYKFYTNFDGTWSTVESCTLSYALKAQDWDIITMQQGSTYSGKSETYEPHLTQLIEYVNANKTNPNARLAWNMTWAYQADFDKDSMFGKYDHDQMKMYDAIVDTVQEKVLPHKEITYLMPVGTAIQNARTSFLGDNLTRDGYHLSELGRVIGSYTWLATFMGKPLEEVNASVISNTLTLTEQQKAVIIAAVNAALKTPQAVTNLQDLQ